MSLIVQDLHSPVYVLTTIFEGVKAGCVITWVSRASLNEKEPRIIMVVSKFNDTLNLLQKSSVFVLNLLHASQLSELIHFGSEHSLSTDKFQHTNYEETSQGIILKDAAGYAFGKIEKSWETPDRFIFYARIIKEKKLSQDVLILQKALEELPADKKEIFDSHFREDTLRDEKQFTST
jgi:flavin reductase (DIM6/NTAB) family NADH-FMN oxidoreductase RutF